MSSSSSPDQQQRLVVDLRAVSVRLRDERVGDFAQRTIAGASQHRFHRVEPQFAILAIEDLGHSVGDEREEIARRA